MGTLQTEKRLTRLMRTKSFGIKGLFLKAAFNPNFVSTGNKPFQFKIKRY